MQEMRRDIEEMQRQAEENKNRAIQQTVGATDEQWLRLKPKLERIVQLKAEAEVAIDPGSAGGNGNFKEDFSFGNGSRRHGRELRQPRRLRRFRRPRRERGIPVDILDSNAPSGIGTPGSNSTTGSCGRPGPGASPRCRRAR